MFPVSHAAEQQGVLNYLCGIKGRYKLARSSLVFFSLCPTLNFGSCRLGIRSLIFVMLTVEDCLMDVVCQIRLEDHARVLQGAVCSHSLTSQNSKGLHNLVAWFVPQNLHSVLFI